MMTSQILDSHSSHLKGDTIIWWGRLTDKPVLNLECTWQMLKDCLQLNKGISEAAAEAEIAQFRRAKQDLSKQVSEHKQQIIAKWSKLTEQDLEDVGDSMEALSGKIQMVYGAGETEADEAVRAYISSL